MPDLRGKIIVLTGGADGIGRECALAYARATRPDELQNDGNALA